MTVKEELRQLIESLDEDVAAEALSFVRVLVSEQRIEDDDTEAILARGLPFTLDDPLWEIVGVIDDDGPTDVSSNKHKYLAEAYADLQEE